MKWLPIIFAFTLFIGGCAERNVKAPESTNQETEKVEESIQEEPSIQEYTVEENESKERNNADSQESNDINQETNDNTHEPEEHSAEKLSSEDAVNEVKKYLNLQNSKDTVVEFDHQEDNKYLIHVYDIVQKGEDGEHTATRGWYYVDILTGKVESMF